MGWVGVAAAGVSAVMSIQQGQAAKREADLNAVMMEGKAGLIDVQKDIEKGQYTRMAAQAMGTGMANIAASGIEAKGSPMAVMLETQKQIELDKAIGQFNLEQQKRYTIAEANQIRRQGKAAQTAGYTNALVSTLGGVEKYGTYKGWWGGINTSSGATTAGKGK